MTIIGRLGTEPELVSTQSGQDFVKYSVGTSHGIGENQKTSWWRVASFAKEGSPIREKLMELPKGTMVYVEGEASMRKFEKEGKTENALSLVQSKIEVLRRPDSARSEAAMEESPS
ncbi:ssDNA-binding protein, mitochondrial [Thelotrema lepadinum]|nr:ssDNA-binding protein, mitochondrial [Thelotrema lepadinum]